MTAGARVTDSEAGPIFAMQFEKRSADIAAFPIAAAPEAPVPDETTARRWYDNHPDLYATPEYRRVKVIVFSPATLAPDVTVTDQDVLAAYDEHKADYTSVARRSVQLNPRFSVCHIFLTSALVGLGRIEEAKAEAQRVLALEPAFTIRRFAVTAGFEPKVFTRLSEAWRAAGLPDG